MSIIDLREEKGVYITEESGKLVLHYTKAFKEFSVILSGIYEGTNDYLAKKYSLNTSYSIYEDDNKNLYITSYIINFN